jgi:regulatory protein YycH of two-component signal transduction system YycFG
MVMNLETIKTVVLTILVFTSVYLTWSIWTYQPNLDPIEQSPYIQEVAISDKQELASVIKPSQILYHLDGKHYATTDEKEISKVMKELAKWTLFNMKNVSDTISKKEFTTFIHGNGNTEIKFSNDIPISTFKSILDIQDKDLPDTSFDRIVFNTGQGKNEEDSLYFISYKNRLIYKSSLNASYIEDFYKNYFRFAYRYPEYFSVELTEGKTLFLPKQYSKMNKYKYYPVFLDTKKFRDALFSDPSFVKQDLITQGEEYTDGSSLMNVYYDTMMIYFVNPAQRKPYPVNADELLKRSVEFINDHAGWEDQYRFAGLNEAEQKTVFRLHLQGLPVFNEAGMSEIVQVWGKDEIYQYKRPFFSLDFPLPFEIKPESIPSGKEAIEMVMSTRGFNAKLLEDLTIGYHLTRDVEEPKIISLEPAWYYRYDGVWNRVSFQKRGGKLNGLE